MTDPQFHSLVQLILHDTFGCRPRDIDAVATDDKIELERRFSPDRNDAADIARRILAEIEA